MRARYDCKCGRYYEGRLACCADVGDYLGREHALGVLAQLDEGEEPAFDPDPERCKFETEEARRAYLKAYRETMHGWLEEQMLATE